MAVGMAPNTLLKWMKQPEFDTAYLVVRKPSSFIASSGVSATTVGIEPNCRDPEKVELRNPFSSTITRRLPADTPKTRVADRVLLNDRCPR